MAEETAPAAAGGGSFLTRKFGPLPTWAWMDLVLGGALAFASWRSNKASAPGGTGAAGQTAQDYGTATDPYQTFVAGDTTVINNIPAAPPIGGRTPDPTPAGPTIPTPVTPAPTSVVPTPAVPAKTAPPPAPAGQYVTVVKYIRGQQRGTPSTLWGIAERVYGTANGASWPQIWAAPQNASLRTKRKDPKLIQPGDRVWVPTK